MHHMTVCGIKLIFEHENGLWPIFEHTRVWMHWTKCRDKTGLVGLRARVVI